MKNAIAVLALFCAVAVSQAQQDFFHRPSPFAGRTILTLSLFEEVRLELKTTPEIHSQEDNLLTKIQREIQEAIQTSNGDLSGMRKTIDNINVKYEDDCLKLLSGEQAKRLKELFIQFNGGNSVTNPVIAKDLAITDDQRAQIKKAQEENQKKVLELFKSGGGVEDNRQDREKLQEELKANLEKLLTDSQKAKFKGMQGAKFEFKKPAPPLSTLKKFI